MQISEIFHSIQGEGINIGVPSIFLRLSGCHLRCNWCDTKFAWPLNSGKKMSISEVIKSIKKYPCKNLIITGGEPLLQQKELKELIKKLPEYFIEIETSGTIKSELGKLVNQYNCSPKLKNSGNKDSKLQIFPKTKTFYKFVVSKKKDLKEINSLIKKKKLPKNRIILMPEGKTPEELKKKSKWLTELCKKENHRFSPRLHINIWDNKRKK